MVETDSFRRSFKTEANIRLKTPRLVYAGLSRALVYASFNIIAFFRVFGELKTVRLPKKMGGTGTHRGFGFVDFLTKQDAKVHLRMFHCMHFLFASLWK